MFEFRIKSPVGAISKKFLHRYQARVLHGGQNVGGVLIESCIV